MVYDSRNNDARLILFGGWKNEWLDDLWSLNVSTIVGPSYAITECVPNLGQLSGGTNVMIKGVGFKDATITVRFICGKQYVEAPGVYISETELSCLTPSFEHIGPKDAEVRLFMQGGDLTTTLSQFAFFMNTRAFICLAYGPGLLED
jgi:dynein heavy chain